MAKCKKLERENKIKLNLKLLFLGAEGIQCSAEGCFGEVSI